MNNDERCALASLYVKWETASLLDAVTRHPSEYDPQALELMGQELARRGATAQPLESMKPSKPYALPPIGQSPPQFGIISRPHIQYVGAWGLNILLSCAIGIPLTLAINGVRPHDQAEAVVATLVFIVGGLVLSFLAFWLSVKWMIVDRLSQQPKCEIEKRDAHRDSDAPCLTSQTNRPDQPP
jgi:hypothetical protein